MNAITVWAVIEAVADAGAESAVVRHVFTQHALADGCKRPGQVVREARLVMLPEPEGVWDGRVLIEMTDKGMGAVEQALKARGRHKGTKKARGGG